VGQVRSVVLVVVASSVLATTVVTSSGGASSNRDFHVPIVDSGRLLTTFGGAGPITFTTADGVEHRLTAVRSKRTVNGVSTLEVSTDAGGTKAQVTLRAIPGGHRVSVNMQPSRGVKAVRITLSASANAHFLGTGERTRWVDMRRTVQPLKVWSSCASSAPAPFFASSTGLGAWVEGDAIGRIAFPGAIDDSNFTCDLGEPPCSVGPAVGAVRICVKAAQLTIDVVRGSPKEIVSAYVRHAGLPRAPWLPHFALMKWRDSVSGPSELFDDIDQLRSRGLPVGWVILDNPWEAGVGGTGCFGSLRFDPSAYPDPAAVIRRIHALGVRFMLWVSPQIRKKGCPVPALPDGSLTNDDEYYLRDLTNPPERAEFVSKLTALAALGVDGFKGDRGDEVDLEDATLHGGSGLGLQNAYPRLYQRAVAAAMQPFHKQWASLFRTAVPGSASIVPGFVGDDAQHSWNGLQGSIHSAQTAGIAGEAMWGSDIGGYDGGDLTAEIFARWAQFAALTPIFEVGGAGENATFWQFGQQTVESFRAAATLHYELVPYLFELVRQASENGLPAVRPLGLTWPSDARAWAHDLEFTVGDALLAAPVVAPANGPTATSKVYLPAGTWIDLFSGVRVAGSRTIERSSGLNDFPLYVRVGTALPFNARAPAVWAAPWRPDDLVRRGRQGWLVAPRVDRTEQARSGTARLVATQLVSRRITIDLSGAAPEQQILVFPERSICRVTAGGRNIPHTAAGALVSKSHGWLTEQRGQAVVIKLHVPRHTRVTLLACAP
jgi:alpha-D-xyloside xylohydrolase